MGIMGELSVTVEEIEYPRRIEDFVINPADDGYIIYQPELDRLHFLNPIAVVILELCNGQNSLADIVGLVKEGFGLADEPLEPIREAVAKMKDEGLLL